MKSKQIIKDALVLFLITVIAGLGLGFVYNITKDPIEMSNKKAKDKACQQVFEDASFEMDDTLTKKAVDDQASWLKDAGIETGVVVEEALYAKDSNGEKLGYVFTVVGKEGYGGDIKMILGIKMDGTITGLEVLAMSETAGLGAKCTTPEFRNQFIGKNVDAIEYSKSDVTADNQIAAISGATITTKAVTKAVNAAVYFVKNQAE